MLLVEEPLGVEEDRTYSEKNVTDCSIVLAELSECKHDWSNWAGLYDLHIVTCIYGLRAIGSTAAPPQVRRCLPGREVIW